MTSEQIEAITSSWEKVSQEKDLITCFYGKLFEIAPQTKRYFPQDLTKQSEKLAYTLGFVVGNLDRLEDIKEAVEDLGRTHRKLKIKDEEYGYVKEALLITIDEAIEGDNTTALQAWDSALSYIAGVMINAPDQRKVRKRSLFKRLFNK
ncbi:globin domain-containing protein [Ekhidna sp. To15]|uniref:globin domain-containing protein n=1 Tax=Ekhidna sp. To15 TaxID=3395267 RepID=UPI003F522F9E